MEIMDFSLMVGADLIGTIGKYVAQPIQCLALPLAHLQEIPKQNEGTSNSLGRA